jgi:hypothetical protein
MFELEKNEAHTVSGGFYSIYDGFYVIVSNNGISDRCYLILDDLFGKNFNQQLTSEEASKIAFNCGCNSDSLQYNANVANGLYYTIPA